jgi:GTP-binding protein HflX
LNEEIRADKRHFGRAVLVGVQFPRQTRGEVLEHLTELQALVATLGVEVAATELVRLDRPSPKLLVGSGKAEEIIALLDAHDADLLVFDDDLSPPQQHLWEKTAKRAVIDRRKVIIDIFGQRARTREAHLQVDLARLEYTLPRLKRAWTHLERQRGGGSFVGGAGEAQIEVDRRIVRDKIAHLRRDLVEVRRHRDNQRKGRDRSGIPTVAIVGYTNSGKSTLLNALTGAGVLAEDKLFATLDPTTRRVVLPNAQPVLVTDTVGFIRKLPHTLIEAFKSTLEEATTADYLLHVVDASHPKALEQCEVTLGLLEELGAGDKPTVLALNKIDRLEDPVAPEAFAHLADRVVPISARSGRGLGDLVENLMCLTGGGMANLHLRIPTSRFDLVSSMYRNGEVLEERYGGGAVLLHVRVPARLESRLAEFATAPW